MRPLFSALPGVKKGHLASGLAVALLPLVATTTSCSDDHAPGIPWYSNSTASTGGAGGSGGDGGDGSIETQDATAEDLCTVTKTAIVNIQIFNDAQSRCVDGQEPAFLEAQSDAAEQVKALRAECSPGDIIFDLYDQALQGGRVRFDAGKLTACLAEGKETRATASPEIFKAGFLDALKNDPSCSHVWVPLQQENEECAEDWECPLGTHCEAATPTGNTLKCLVGASAGAACGGFRTCADALFCGPTGACAPRTANGKACSSSDECLVDSYCATDGTCQPIPKQGEPCDDICAEGLECKLGFCAPPPSPVATGDYCTGACAAPCSVCRPQSPGDSEANYRCLPRSTANGACALFDEECIAGLYCNVIAGRCETPLSPGMSCAAPGVQCAEDVWCDSGGTQTCMALPGQGKNCLQGMCAAGLVCSVGKCLAGNLGDPCDPAEQDGAVCRQTGLVCTGGAGSETCQPEPGPGAPCAGAGQICADGAFCNALSMCETQYAPGAACSSDDECPGECYHGKCTPDTPGGCDDLRDQLVTFFTMGLLGVFSRRRANRQGV